MREPGSDAGCHFNSRANTYGHRRAGNGVGGVHTNAYTHAWFNATVQ